MTHGEEWFWGGEFSAEKKAEVLGGFDVLIQVGGALACMKYDRLAGVAVVHVVLEEDYRGGKNVGRLIARAIDRARLDGMQKIMAPLLAKSPFLKPNRDRKFGFTREAILRRHVMVAGMLQDLHLYSMFL